MEGILNYLRKGAEENKKAKNVELEEYIKKTEAQILSALEKGKVVRFYHNNACDYITNNKGKVDEVVLARVLNNILRTEEPEEILRDAELIIKDPIKAKYKTNIKDSMKESKKFREQDESLEGFLQDNNVILPHNTTLDSFDYDFEEDESTKDIRALNLPKMPNLPNSTKTFYKKSLEDIQDDSSSVFSPSSLRGSDIVNKKKLAKTTDDPLFVRGGKIPPNRKAFKDIFEERFNKKYRR